MPFLILVGRLTWRSHTQENLELQRVQGDLENQLRKRQREIESLQAELNKRDTEHRAKQTGDGLRQYVYKSVGAATNWLQEQHSCTYVA